MIPGAGRAQSLQLLQEQPWDTEETLICSDLTFPGAKKPLEQTLGQPLVQALSSCRAPSPVCALCAPPLG